MEPEFSGQLSRNFQRRERIRSSELSLAHRESYAIYSNVADPQAQNVFDACTCQVELRYECVARIDLSCRSILTFELGLIVGEDIKLFDERPLKVNFQMLSNLINSSTKKFDSSSLASTKNRARKRADRKSVV